MNQKLILCLASLLWVSSAAVATQPVSKKRPVYPRTPSGFPTSTLMNINNFSMWVQHDGLMSRNPFSGNSGVTFPRGTATCIFADGLLWGGMVHDGGSQMLRVNGQNYVTGTVPGRIISPGVRENPNDSTVRIYRIRRDWSAADLREDAAELLNESIPSVTQAQIDSVRAQYKRDWIEWPWQKGAPFYDRDHDAMYTPDPNAVYDSTKDEPGLAGADQVVWFVINDLDTGQSHSMYGSDPIGLEIQVTLWGYAQSGAAANTIFKRYKVIYKGTASAPPSSFIDSLYLLQWVDPDLGDYSDDFAGCDTTLNLGFVYNGADTDARYGAFGLAPPAVGYDFLQGPIVPSIGDSAFVNFRWIYDYKNLPMTSWIYLASGSTTADPPYNYTGAPQWYNFFKGLTPITGAPFVYPGGGETVFWLSGDPVANTGYLDGFIDFPGDRRMASGTGPFTMALGDTQEVVIALVAGLGSDRLSSVTAMKENDKSIQTAFNLSGGAALAVPPGVLVTSEFSSSTSTTIHLVADARGTRAIDVVGDLRRYTGSRVSIITLADDGLHGDGVAGDQIFGGSISVPPESVGMYLDEYVQYGGGAAATFHHAVDDITTAGPVPISSYSISSDNLNSDGVANPGENVRYVVSVRNGSALTLSKLTMATFPPMEGRQIRIPSLSPSGSFFMSYNPNDSLSYFKFDVSPGYSDSLFRVVIAISDTQHNRWTDTIAFPVKAPASPFYGTPLVHTAGQSDWSFNILAVDQAQIKNHTYEVSVTDSSDSAHSRWFSLRDLTDGTPLILHHTLPDPYGHDVPVTDGFKVLRGTAFGRVGLRRDSTRWISSNAVWIHGNRFTDFSDEQSAFNGGVTTGFELGYHYLGNVSSIVDPSRSFSVEVRFDSTAPQKAYRLRRMGPYLIQSPGPFVTVPFSAWDVSDRSTPRQLTVSWRDQDNSQTWNPSVDNDGLEIIFIYQKAYDPTGTTQFTMPPNAIPGECTFGSRADIVYGLSLAVVSGHTLSESGGTLYLRPWFGLSSADRYTFNPTVVSVRDDKLPEHFSLSQNFPNPFNPSTTITYHLPFESRVTLRIYNVLGQEVKTLVDGFQEPGEKKVQWNGTNRNNRGVSTGVYFYEIEAAGKANPAVVFRQVKKMMVIR